MDTAGVGVSAGILYIKDSIFRIGKDYCLAFSYGCDFTFLINFSHSLVVAYPDNVPVRSIFGIDISLELSRLPLPFEHQHRWEKPDFVNRDGALALAHELHLSGVDYVVQVDAAVVDEEVV